MRGAGHEGRGSKPDGTALLRALDAGLSPALLERALTHRSFAYENGGLPTNERLEFLGDAVLGLVVTDALFRGYPDLPEGHLAKLRAAVVNMRALADVARGLHLGDYVRLGRGEEGTGGRDKSSILADTLEAVIGAVYIERGLDTAAELVHRLFDPVIAHSARLGAGLDWKTSLQELTAAGLMGVPEYKVEESGPDHQKSFRALVRVGGRVYGSGKGRSKKEAEQQAAEAAWSAISKGEAGVRADDAGFDTDAAAPGDAPPGDPHDADLGQGGAAGPAGNGAGAGSRDPGAGKDAGDHGTARPGGHPVSANGAGAGAGSIGAGGRGTGAGAGGRGAVPGNSGGPAAAADHGVGTGRESP
jgi:ribonuclease III